MVNRLFTIIILVSLFSARLSGQQYLIELTFTGALFEQPIMLDSINIQNITQPGDTTLYYPDNTLTLFITNVDDNLTLNKDNFFVTQNLPDPQNTCSVITLYLVQKGNVNMKLYGIYGNLLTSISENLYNGYHTFEVYSGSEKISFLSIEQKNVIKIIKLFNPYKSQAQNIRIKYISSNNSSPTLKMGSSRNFSFTLGDELKYVGYTQYGKDSITDSPEQSKIYGFHYVDGTACTNLNYIIYGDEVYYTVKIESQCWLRKNLNIGVMIPGSQEMTDNGIIEKYCYNNDPANCTIYGGLYQWDETMQYTTIEGAVGICPAGWHIPSDGEWKVLEGTVDSQYEVGDPIWNTYGWRGLDAGGNLKETGYTHWNSPNTGATNESGFTGLPGGVRDSGSEDFIALSYYGNFWSSSQYGPDLALYRKLHYTHADVAWDYYPNEAGFSIRCLKDD